MIIFGLLFGFVIGYSVGQPSTYCVSPRYVVDRDGYVVDTVCKKEDIRWR